MPTVNNMTFQFAGAAGTGCDSQGSGWARSMTRAGLWVYAYFDFESRIRGGHIFYQIRVGQDRVEAHGQGTHVLLAFDEQAVRERIDDILPGGAVIFDENYKLDDSFFEGRDLLAIRAPLLKFANEIGGNKLMANTAAVGVLVGITNFSADFIERSLREAFTGRYPGERGEKLAAANIEVLHAAVEFGSQFQDQFDYRLEPLPGGENRILLDGNVAIGIGAIAGGCRFISGYPMTPATSVLEYLASQQVKYGIVVKQTEDEIAALLTAIGSAHVGARSMTSTSGGGFCLMVEALGLAGCSETGVVIVNAQRAGPSTGMPTRTEQGDLDFVLSASHGEFPRLVLTPGSVEECFEAGHRAFNLADKYQTPVIIMTDLFQAFALKTVERPDLDFESVIIDRGKLVTDEELDAIGPDEMYVRHKLSPDGISPRALPGHPRGVYMTTGDEHTERGFITEAQSVRIQQMDKRMQKLETARPHMLPPERYGHDDPDITLVGWGSTRGPIREAVDRLNADGQSAGAIHFPEVWPLPESTEETLNAARYLVGVEQNYSGQFAGVIRRATGINFDHRILKYDSKQITPGEIVAAVKQEVSVGV